MNAIPEYFFGTLCGGVLAGLWHKVNDNVQERIHGSEINEDFKTSLNNNTGQ